MSSLPFGFARRWRRRRDKADYERQAITTYDNKEVTMTTPPAPPQPDPNPAPEPGPEPEPDNGQDEEPNAT